MIKSKTSLGPAVYAQATGVAVTFGENEKVVAAVAVCDNDEVLGAVNTIYALHTVITGKKVNVLVYSQATVGGAGNAWAEIANASNLAARTFTVIAQVE